MVSKRGRRCFSRLPAVKFRRRTRQSSRVRCWDYARVVNNMGRGVRRVSITLESRLSGSGGRSRQRAQSALGYSHDIAIRSRRLSRSPAKTDRGSPLAGATVSVGRLLAEIRAFERPKPTRARHHIRRASAGMKARRSLLCRESQKPLSAPAARVRTNLRRRRQQPAESLCIRSSKHIYAPIIDDALGGLWRRRRPSRAG